MTLPCQTCGQPAAFIIRGRCGTCDPELHAHYSAAARAYQVADLEYHFETGRAPLQDWEAFEEWNAQYQAKK